MTRTITSIALFTLVAACGGPEPSVGTTTRASGNGCPTCLAELTITQVGPSGLGDLSRDPDDTYATWSAGSVKLSCDDGTVVDAVTLSIEPYDLEDGIDLTNVGLPNVDLEATGLTCELQVDDGTQSSTIVVDIQ